MEVLNQRSALLSNYEVLSLLKELESNHLARTKTAHRIKKEEEAAGLPPKHQPHTDDVSENLRTVEVEAISYLSADYQPSVSQTAEGITQLTRTLGQWDLTKAEKLQIVNLAPTEPVELYVIVEELEDRYGDQMEDILTAVKTSLKDSSPAVNGASGAAESGQMEATYTEYAEDYVQDAEHWDHNANEVVFDDTGEGAGIEGDLDVDDDA
ncbi:DNA-directed RNA polymerase III subunit RPC9 [Trametes pubescens]|uniref:DNA-directed RNA polymerase III subunit RPC9 n=1 Tax=Trametes pubescens TaxID=154538 RepID=A0A1M2VZM6_TRAPU|nr:DNA-directed RNA polymerase III subunit RPC9 [Trametes pubescens]